MRVNYIRNKMLMEKALGAMMLRGLFLWRAFVPHTSGR
jgi:hypothetical protein